MLSYTQILQAHCKSKPIMPLKKKVFKFLSIVPCKQKNTVLIRELIGKVGYLHKLFYPLNAKTCQNVANINYSLSSK